ncbi:hypothetical protein M404DRAFT_324825 [Pisolithus tinctorius Marx 270]|uniref:Uncharacterized protein n=1 Tax=Pisolithus tinctorius Marx 270 TaxID=870435 RepID=A0A0C3PKG6_PISTI|nr:hypothetical protein M404DRAFT_324825 [Pisolithus tinctorius Marx 270]
MHSIGSPLLELGRAGLCQYARGSCQWEWFCYAKVAAQEFNLGAPARHVDWNKRWSKLTRVLGAFFSSGLLKSQLGRSQCTYGFPTGCRHHSVAERHPSNTYKVALPILTLHFSRLGACHFVRRPSLQNPAVRGL